MGVPGLKVVVPRSPLQAKGLLLASILDPNPVLFLEPKGLYRSAVEGVPTDAFTLPLSTAEVVRAGADATLVTWGAPVHTCVAAAEMLARPTGELGKHVPAGLAGAEVEVVDLRTVLPWDRAGVARAVARTGRCVLVHEAPVTMGAGAEVAAAVQEDCFLSLEAPVGRVGGFDTPFPHTHEHFYKPDVVRVLDCVRVSPGVWGGGGGGGVRSRRMLVLTRTLARDGRSSCALWLTSHSSRKPRRKPRPLVTPSRPAAT